MKTLTSLFLFNLLSFSFFGQTDIQLTEIQSNFVTPVDITHAGDDRLFIVEQQGRIQVIEANGNITNTPFLDISNKIRFGGERGLLGLAFHPNFLNNGLFYVNYTATNGNTQIASYRVPAGGTIANTNSENILLSIPQPFPNHNGGGLKFGADGYLYIGLGDGGSARDPQNNSQNDGTLLGKMLRIAVTEDGNHGIPPDNPFINNPNIPNEIWATGLRNPWRFSFDRTTNDLWIADVGQNSFEEINKVTSDMGSGIDFGWRCYEGNVILNASGCANANTFHDPIHTYPTSFNVGMSITGGYVYRGSSYPSLVGKYIYGDYISGRIWALEEPTTGSFVNREIFKMSNNEISTFGEDATGELYVAGYSSGKIFKITAPIISSIKSLSTIQNLTIAPNPFKESTKISFHSNHSISVTYKIFDTVSKVVFEQKETTRTGANVLNLSLTNLHAGVYFLTISGKEGIITKKLIK